MNIVTKHNIFDKMSVTELERAISEANQIYYNSGSTLLTDDEYDMMLDVLRVKSPHSAVLKCVGHPPTTTKNKITLPLYMGSLNKIKSDQIDELQRWMEKQNATPNKGFIVADKLDGVSALLVYSAKDGKRRLMTRGDGTEGTDITPLLKYLSYIPDSVDEKGGDVAVRGELVIPKQVFKMKWQDSFKNPRNFVSGVVNSKNINPFMARDIHFVAFELPSTTELNYLTQLELLKIWKFTVVPHCHYSVELNLSTTHLSELLERKRGMSLYTMDGLVITTVSRTGALAPATGNPDYAVAFKMATSQQECAETTIIDVEWNVSKDGYLKPTIIIEPVELCGATISRVTANNAKYIVDNCLGVGAIIEIIRSGDVIPFIQSIIQSATEPQMPCISFSWHWTETGVDIVLDTHDSAEQCVCVLHHFFATLKIRGIGKKIVERFVEAGLDTVPKILAAKHDEFLCVEGFKHRAATSIETELEKLKIGDGGIEMALLMVASNCFGHGMGVEKFRRILARFPNAIRTISPPTIDELVQIKGIEILTAKQFVNKLPTFCHFYESVLPFIKIVASPPIEGETIVFSGFRDSKMKSHLEQLGFHIADTVTKKTTFVLIKDESTVTDNETSKIKQAQKMGIPILTCDEFMME